MFWRKRNDGFEWHQYVRTTIKLRREARREKAEQLKHQAVGAVKAVGAAAADGVMAASAAAADGVKVAGSVAAGGAKVAGAKAAEGARVAGSKAGAAARLGALAIGTGTRMAASRAGQAARIGLEGLGRTAGRAGSGLVRALGPALDVLAREGLGKPLAIGGAVAVAAGSVRASILRELDGQALVVLLIGVAGILLAFLPRLLIGKGLALPEALATRLPSAGQAAKAGLVLAIAGGAIVLYQGGGVRIGAVGALPSLPFTGTAEIVEGRAAAIGPDVVRIGQAVLRLADIEAPERDQVCTRPGNRRWRCGDSAANALARLANGRALKCELRGRDANGTALATCRDGETDINAQLVKGGLVFAEAGLLARYGALEGEARAAKAGLWGGDAMRPAEWRRKVWEEAKRRAPTGCPIKGQMAGGARTYVLPWSQDYERVRVNPQRGGRWFCSEEEAITAGWRVAGR